MIANATTDWSNLIIAIATLIGASVAAVASLRGSFHAGTAVSRVEELAPKVEQAATAVAEDVVPVVAEIKSAVNGITPGSGTPTVKP